MFSVIADYQYKDCHQDAKETFSFQESGESLSRTYRKSTFQQLKVQHPASFLAFPLFSSQRQTRHVSSKGEGKGSVRPEEIFCITSPLQNCWHGDLNNQKKWVWAPQNDGKDRICPSKIFPPATCLHQSIQTVLKIYSPLDRICALEK